MRTTARHSDPGLSSSGLRRCWPAWMLMLVLPLAAAACAGSSRSGGDTGGDNGPIQASADEDEDYPNLSRVPGEAPRPTPESLRKELIEGLMADHAHARYTGELLTAASAEPPPATPPPAARAQVEIIWQTERVLPEGESKTAEEGAVSEDAAAVEGAGAAPEAAAGEPDAAAEAVDEEVEINWETERVEPSGKVRMADESRSEEELLLAPQPELLAVVYFPQDSTQVAGSDRQLLEDVVARFKERGGRLRLVGHSGGQAQTDEEAQTDDQVAQRMANLELSLERANAVASTLLDLGADKEELLVEAKADNETTGGDVVVGGESSTRKVEIFLEH